MFFQRSLFVECRQHNLLLSRPVDTCLAAAYDAATAACQLSSTSSVMCVDDVSYSWRGCGAPDVSSIAQTGGSLSIDPNICCDSCKTQPWIQKVDESKEMTKHGVRLLRCELLHARLTHCGSKISFIIIYYKT